MGPIIFWVRTNLVPKYFGQKSKGRKMLGQKIFIGQNEFLDPKNNNNLYGNFKDLGSVINPILLRTK